MRVVFYIVFLFGFSERYFSFPQCCHRLYYSDSFFICGISLCKLSEKLLGNICFSCISKVSTNVQSNTNVSVHTPGISKPQELCHDLNRFNSGQVVLSWSWLENNNGLACVFAIEARNDSSPSQEWNFIGLTNETFVTITHLDVGFQHQFQVTPVISFNKTLQSVTSKWIKLRDSSSGLSAPSNVTLASFYLKNGNLEARIKWAASKELPCSYRLIWKLTDVVSYFKEQTITLPKGNSSATITGLLFDQNYTLSITPLVPNSTLKESSAVTWFMTPDCLNVTKGNFSICAPGPPLNVSVHWFSKEVTVQWLPPKYTSLSNLVLGYNVSVFSDGMVLITNLFADKDTLKSSFSDLNSFTNYVFAVSAVAGGGAGKSAVAKVNVKELEALDAAATLPYHYMVPFLLLLLVVVFVTLAKLHKKTFIKKYYPSGVADVDDHIRPFLISSDKIHLREVLGKGAFGVVHRGIYTRSKSKEEVAVKVFPSETNTRHQLLHEVEIMRIVSRHEQIVGLHGISLDVEKMYLVLEYCPLGDLQSYLIQLKPEVLRLKRLVVEKKYSMSEKDKDHGKRLCSYIYQVAQGMEYIASLKLIHRDLAARNILMVDERRVKIADFGLSKDVYENGVYTGCKQKKLPLKWMAPESIEKQKFTIYTDVWSFGVLMWEVFKLGKEPYSGLANSRLLEYLKLGYRLEKPHCSEEWYKLMHKCWKHNPRERPQFKQLVKQIGTMIDKMWIYISVV